MQRIRGFWNAFRNFAIFFSFITNLVLIIVLLVVVREIFIIKNGIAEPLIDGLHANFVGLDSATIDTTIPVNDTIDIGFTLPINQETTVVLTDAVPLSANTSFNLGEFGSINGTVSLNLPVGLALPVQLSMDVPVTATIPIALDVAVQIPLKDTQLHQPFVNLRDLFEPFVRALDNLPDDWDEVPGYGADVVAGNVNLMNETAGSRDPWDEYGEWGIGEPPQVLTPATVEPVQPGATMEPQPTFDPLATPDPNFTPAPTATTIPLIIPGEEANPPAEQPVGTSEPVGEG